MSYKNTIKPVFDRLVALVLIIAFSPVWLLGFIIIFSIQGNTLFYIQCRSGINMKRFRLYKIRTLKNSNDNDLSLSNRSFTYIGKWLRHMSIDELPQLYNVLKGDMSLVGPRPMPVEYETRYNEHQKKRFTSKPGLTGWAQINGRNKISWEKRFEMDNWYVDHISFLLDLKILSHTLIGIFNKSQQPEMPVFTGTKTA